MKFYCQYCGEKLNVTSRVAINLESLFIVAPCLCCREGACKGGYELRVFEEQMMKKEKENN